MFLCYLTKTIRDEIIIIIIIIIILILILILILIILTQFFFTNIVKIS